MQGASSYVLWGESRVPEGRVIFTNEIRTSETVWIPPVPLAEETATVKIRVTALCQDAPSNSPVLVPTANRPTTRFRIESPLNCRIDEEPVSDYHGDTLHLKWTAAPAANEYEVSIRSAIDAKQFTTQSSSFPEAHIRDVPQGVWILSVQARCGKTLGPRRYASIAIR